MNIYNHPVELILRAMRFGIIKFDNNYVASWRCFAPQNEIKVLYHQ